MLDLKLPASRVDRLDDPAEWAKIPILDKETPRKIPPNRFMAEFCVADAGPGLRASGRALPRLLGRARLEPRGPKKQAEL